jgi:hypothetical protein
MKFTHPKFKQFISCLTTYHVEYMLVGGYAVILNGYVRGTGNMDVWVNPTVENRNKLILALINFGYQQEELEVIKQGDPLNSMRGMIEIESFHIDILTLFDKVKFEDAIQQSSKFKIEDTEVSVINFEDLIATKIFSDRLKDKTDIEQLFKLKKNV